MNTEKCPGGPLEPVVGRLCDSGNAICENCGGTGDVCTGTIDGIPELFDCPHCAGTGIEPLNA